ncbi:MAG TPA: cupin domain-containing protein [Stellaceae bacterium]|nr:cupin domain-containing protein [Stellaceae bacterium]
MPIIAHREAAEVPWRPGYRRFTLAGVEHGVSCSASISVIEPGAGAPLHRHEEVDEIIVVLDGALAVDIDGERRVVGADHTIAVPAGVPHSFVVLGPAPARILVFLPKQGAAARTTYLEGEPPQGAARR